MDLKTKYPELKRQFYVTLNNGVDFDKLTVGSMKKVWWKCDKGDDHIWEASVNQRTSGKKLRGCPICAGKKVVRSNSLAVNNPNIAQEWNYIRNRPLTPYQISSGSNKKVWWKCSNHDDHEWEATPKQRTKQNNSCPICNSLGYKYPKTASQWHPTKNGNTTPFDVPYSSHTRYWWKCDKGFDHIWSASPNQRTSLKTECPICSGYKVIKSNSLAYVYPKIALQWNWIKNGSLHPDNIYCRSRKKVWWKCFEGEDHEWEATIKSRVSGVGCPICSGRKVSKSNCLATRFPNVAKLWNYQKNKDLTPYDVTPFSNKTVWWKCPKGDDHEWESTVANVINGSTCPVCLNRKITDSNNVFALFPRLKDEWNFVKNKDINPYKLSSGSKLKVWWICKRDNEHEWFSTIKDRAHKNSGCPYCSIKLNVSEIKMLEIIRDIFNGVEVKYRNKPKWLKRMELDVYIPSLRIGFEYQGIQHFKPIDFFGGEETFIAQVKRDKLKKEICDEKGVLLIYIYYDEILSENLIKEKLYNAGIII